MRYLPAGIIFELCSLLFAAGFFPVSDASVLLRTSYFLCFNMFWELVMVCFRFEGEISTLKRIISACELHTTHVFILSLKFEFWESSGQKSAISHPVIWIFCFHGVF